MLWARRGNARLQSSPMDLAHLAALHRRHVGDLQSRYEDALRAAALDAW